MIWEQKLEESINTDKAAQPVPLKAFVSETLDRLETYAKKLAFAIHDMGFVRARAIFEPYWTGMSSGIDENTETSGMLTSITIDREMNYPFVYIINLIVTENGILVNKKYRYTHSGTEEKELRILALGLEDLENMEHAGELNNFVNNIMLDFADSFKEFVHKDEGKSS